MQEAPNNLTAQQFNCIRFDSTNAMIQLNETSGANTFLISKASGHPSTRSAEVYARLLEETVRDARSNLTKNCKQGE